MGFVRVDEILYRSSMALDGRDETFASRLGHADVR
jgi:hypothetical protein